MKLDNTSVLVDNDFIGHILETKLDKDVIASSLKEAFLQLNKSAFMHPLVYENELLPGNKELPVFSTGVIVKADFSDIHLEDETKKSYYTYLVRELFNYICGEELKYTNEEIFTRWMSHKNLGEVHSLTTCLICESSLFLSDDDDSKKLQKHIKEKALGKVVALSRKEFFDLYVTSGGNKIPREHRKKLGHKKCN